MTRKSIVLGARLRCHDAVKVMRIATGEVGGVSLRSCVERMTQKFHTGRRGLRSTRLAIPGRRPYRKVADGNSPNTAL
jgi:hypothetical protein